MLFSYVPELLLHGVGFSCRSLSVGLIISLLGYFNITCCPVTCGSVNSMIEWSSLTTKLERTPVAREVFNTLCVISQHTCLWIRVVEWIYMLQMFFLDGWSFALCLFCVYSRFIPIGLENVKIWVKRLKSSTLLEITHRIYNMDEQHKNNAVV